MSETPVSFWQWFSTKFHTHEWEVHDETLIAIYRDGHIGDPNFIRSKGVRYILRCKVCGEMKNKDLV